MMITYRASRQIKQKKMGASAHSTKNVDEPSVVGGGAKEEEYLAARQQQQRWRRAYHLLHPVQTTRSRLSIPSSFTPPDTHADTHTHMGACTSHHHHIHIIITIQRERERKMATIHVQAIGCLSDSDTPLDFPTE
jgi:hypothetical protein